MSLHLEQSQEKPSQAKLFSDLQTGVTTQLAALAAADDSSLTAARASLSDALNALLLLVASTDVPEAERRALDASLSAEAAALKGALFKALKDCALHRAFLGLPLLMEETRRLLTAAPAKGVATYLEVELCASIDACKDPRALVCVQEVLRHMAGDGKLKKELGGFELPGPSKKSCRTATNRAAKAFTAMEEERRKQAIAADGPIKVTIEMPDADFRREDEARYESAVDGVDALFDQAMAIKNKQ